MDINLDVVVRNPVNRGMERKTCEGNQNSHAENLSLLKFYWSLEPRLHTAPRLQPEGGSGQRQSPLLPRLCTVAQRDKGRLDRSKVLETDHQSSSYLGEDLPVSQGHQARIWISIHIAGGNPQCQS